ncbi:MAG: TIGR03560 family F420-dependent LLM class oxidoreductase [Tepidiformaceae bacterium]
MRIGLMVEGQNGLTWERWRHILALAERLAFPTLFRSDHYFIGNQQDSLEAYLSFVMAAAETKTVRFGPLVSPVTFRSPVDVGRMGAQLDLLSGGRFVMGLGAGWNEPEHRAYGIPFPPVKERFDRLEEAIQVIRSLWGPGPASFEGRYYRLDGADCQPKPAPGRPPLLIGGAGEKRTLLLAARHAAEWNCVNLSPEQFAHKRSVLERHCEAEGRDPATIARSMMAFALVGPSQQAIESAARGRMRMFGAPPDTSPSEFIAGMKSRGLLAGATDEVVDTLGRLAGEGLREVQFQHFDFDSDDVPEYLAAEIAPRVRGF